MERLTSFLTKRTAAGTLRQLAPAHHLGGGRLRLPGSDTVLLDFSSNDYLALTEHPAVIAESSRCLNGLGTGAGAARLMSGDLELHHRLEEKVAELKKCETALLFGSGYLANTGVIPALVGRGDIIFTDRFNHASIYDGCRLSGATLVRFHHNDLNHLTELIKKRRPSFNNSLIIVESIYSMDGDRCPLPEVIKLKEEHDCLLLVDEAHATGIFGQHGGGIIEEDGVEDSVDLVIGTFGKALGSYGAYVATNRQMKDYLVNTARTFIYATALPPAVVGASLAALDIIKSQPALREELHRNVATFKESLCNNGYRGQLGPSHIVPFLVGDNHEAVRLAAVLREKGIYATPVRPPTVPAHTARLRFSITRHHSTADLKKTAALLTAILPKKT